MESRFDPSNISSILRNVSLNDILKFEEFFIIQFNIFSWSHNTISSIYFNKFDECYCYTVVVPLK